MKYVLRDRTTGHFLKRAGEWAERAVDALMFDDLLDVREYCQAHRIEGLQVVRHLRPYLRALLRSRSDLVGVRWGHSPE